MAEARADAAGAQSAPRAKRAERANASAAAIESANANESDSESGGGRAGALATADENAGASCCGERAHCEQRERSLEQPARAAARRALEFSASRVAESPSPLAPAPSVSLQDGGSHDEQFAFGRHHLQHQHQRQNPQRQPQPSQSPPPPPPPRPVILITEPARERSSASDSEAASECERARARQDRKMQQQPQQQVDERSPGAGQQRAPAEQAADQFEVIDGISYRIVAAVTRKQPAAGATGVTRAAALQRPRASSVRRRQSLAASRSAGAGGGGGAGASGTPSAPARPARFSSVRRKSTALVANLSAFLVPQSRSSHALGEGPNASAGAKQQQAQSPQTQAPAPQLRRMSIYELTKSPPPETSIEMYLNERRRSSTVSASFVAQQLEQQTTFESNYSARQQYFKDLNAKLINQDRRLLNVVANRGQIHRHSVDIAQLPLFLATQSAAAARDSTKDALDSPSAILREEDEEPAADGAQLAPSANLHYANKQQQHPLNGSINQVPDSSGRLVEPETGELAGRQQRAGPSKHLAAISEGQAANEHDQRQRASLGQLALVASDKRLQAALAGAGAGSGPEGALGVAGRRPGERIVRRFQKFNESALSSAPSPDVKIGQRVAYKEYYGNEFGTIRWIGRVPQISADWTVGVEFDNAIGEGDGSLNGRRYFIAKDCFAKFLALASVTLVDQHVGRPEPGTMISVMSAAVRPGQMISIQRVSTVHVQHCFLNAPHRRPGAEFLAVNTRLHCQCPNCGPCAHVVKPPRTQRLVTPKNATHMCQFSTYTCCGMESSDAALCTYTGNKISSLPPPPLNYASGGSLPPIGNSWMDGSGYLSQLQAEQRKLMPDEYKLGAAPEDLGVGVPGGGGGGGGPFGFPLSRGSSGRRRHRDTPDSCPPSATPTCNSAGCGARACSGSPAAPPEANGEAPQAQRHHHNHRKHHHHHHRRHKHRHKSPAAGERAHEEGAPSPPQPPQPPQPPLYVNLDEAARQEDAEREPIDMQNARAASAGEPREHRPRALSRGNGHLAHDRSPPSMRTPSPATPRNQSDNETQRAPERGLRAVQHRDSIENRYLFPTDDIIDSLLEADLDTLSQARYGRAANAHGRHSSASSAASGRARERGRRKARGAARSSQRRRRRHHGHRHHRHHHHDRHHHQRGRRSSSVLSRASSANVANSSVSERGPSSLILRRLRSLALSCLSAASGNASPTPTPTQTPPPPPPLPPRPPPLSKSNHYAETPGATYSGVGLSVGFGGVGGVGGAQLAAVGEHARAGSAADWAQGPAHSPADCCCRLQATECAYGPLAHQTTITNEIIAASSTTASNGFCLADAECQQPADILKASPALLGAAAAGTVEHQLSENDNNNNNNNNNNNHHERREGHHEHHLYSNDLCFEAPAAALRERCADCDAHALACDKSEGPCTGADPTSLVSRCSPGASNDDAQLAQRRRKLICNHTAGRRPARASGAKREASCAQNAERVGNVSSSSDCGFSSASQNSINASYLT